MITGSVHGVGNVARLLNKTLPNEAQKELAGAIKDEAQQLASVMRMAAPSATGRLRGDITIKTSKKGLSARIGVFSALRGFIARLIVFGVKPHDIAPKNRKALAFNGRVVASARHPGTHADDFMLQTTESARGSFQQRLREAMTAALKAVSK